MKEWLKVGSLPDDPEFNADLKAVDYGAIGTSRLASRPTLQMVRANYKIASDQVRKGVLGLIKAVGVASNVAITTRS